MTSVPVLGRRRAVPRAWLLGRHGRIRPRRALAALLLATLAAGPLEAQRRRAVVVPQPLAVIAHRDLTFGTVLPGIPTAVDARDVVRAALFEIQGPEDAAVRVEFVLPSALTATGGGVLPIVFSGGDGNAAHTLTPSPGGFSPHLPLISTLGTLGRIYVRLGGTVQPGVPQAGGAYSATIHLTVYDIST